jgi:hypothetical protein
MDGSKEMLNGEGPHRLRHQGHGAKGGGVFGIVPCDFGNEFRRDSKNY